MIMSSSRCVIPNCNKESSNLTTTTGPKRIMSIISSSKARGDDIHITLERDRRENLDLSVQCRSDCVSTYTSKRQLKRVARKRGTSYEGSQS